MGNTIRVRERFRFLDTSGNTDTAKDLLLRSGDYPYYESPDQVSYVDDYDADGLFVVVPSQGHIADRQGKLRVALAQGRATFSSHCLALTAADPEDVQFLYHVLSNQQAGLGTGGVTGAAHLTQEMLGALRIPWPAKRLRHVFSLLIEALDKRRQLLRSTRACLISLVAAFTRDVFEVSNSQPVNPCTIGELGVFAQGSFPKRDELSPVGSYDAISSRGPVGKASKPNAGAPSIVLGCMGKRVVMYWCDSPTFVTEDAYFIDQESTSIDLPVLFCSLLSLGVEFPQGFYREISSNNREVRTIDELLLSSIDLPEPDKLAPMSLAARTALKQLQQLIRAERQTEDMKRALFRNVIDFQSLALEESGRDISSAHNKAELQQSANPDLSSGHEREHTNEDPHVTCANFICELLELLHKTTSIDPPLLLENPLPRGFEVMSELGRSRSYCLIGSDDTQGYAIQSFIAHKEASFVVSAPQSLFSIEIDPVPSQQFDQCFCDIAENYDGIWSSKTVDTQDPRWFFGTPARNKSDYAWIQQTLSHLTAEGTALIMAPNISLHINEGRNKDARVAFCKSGLIEAVISFPGKLEGWYQMPITCLVIRASNKKVPSSAEERDTTSQILFMDARELASTGDGGTRTLSEANAQRIIQTYRAWTSTSGPIRNERFDIPGFCYAATEAELKDNGYDLRPWTYTSVGSTTGQQEVTPADVSQWLEKYEGLFEQRNIIDKEIEELYAQYRNSEN